MRTRDWLVAAIGAGLVLTAGAAYPWGLEQGGVSVAVIDNERVFLESAAGQAAKARLDQSAAALQGRINTAEQELAALQQQRASQAATLNVQALAELDQQVEQTRLQVQRLREDAQREFNRLREQVISELETTLTPIVEALAEEQGYQVILNTQTPGLLYYADAIDVTEQLIARANQSPVGSP